MEANENFNTGNDRRKTEDRRSGSNERRQFPRIARRITTRFQVAEDSQKKWDIILLDNLSAGGVLFRHNEKLEVGTLINLVMSFPNASEQPLLSVAKVLRVKQFQGLLIYEIAAQFTQIDEKTIKLINDIVEKYKN